MDTDNNNEKKQNEKFNFPSTISYLTHIKDTKTSGEINEDDDNVMTGTNEYDKDYVNTSRMKKEDLEREMSTIHEFFKNSASSRHAEGLSAWRDEATF